MADHLETILEQTAALRAPIAGDAPTGVDMFLEPELEPAKAELDKLTSMSGGDVSWSTILSTAEETLQNRSKDLRLAMWLTAGGAAQNGWRGLARGLVVANGLVADFWEGLFPTRPKARVNIVTWLSERVLPIVESLKIVLSDGDDVKLAAAEIEKLDKALIDKLGDAYPGVRSLVNATKGRVKDIPVPPPPKPAAPAATAKTGDFVDDDAPAPSAGGVQLGTAAADAPATTATVAGALVSLARSMLLADTSRAWAYRLHRQGIWLQYEAVSLQGAAGPDAASIALLGELMAAARWPELVIAGEEASMRAPLWLDPHRYVAHALERMGTPFVDARQAVGRDTSDFVRRNAWLLDARFANGTPAASPDTVEWIRQESRRWQLGATAEDVVLAEDRDAAARFEEAKNLVTAGRYVEGLAIAVQLARRGADTRDRFRASLDVARLAMGAGANDVARPILEGLVATATAHSLETWDPTLCARLYAGLYRVLPADAPDRAKVFEMLCRIDPGAALRAQGAAVGPPSRSLPGAGGMAPVAPAPVAFAQPFMGQPAQPAQSNGAANGEESAPPPPDRPPPKVIPNSDWVDDD